MRFRPILLRLLMITALVANGGGNAFAATRMQLLHASADLSALAAEPVVAQVAAPPCHEQAGAAASDSLTTTEPGTDDTSGADHGSPDCCADGTCLCACLQQASAMTANVDAIPPGRERAGRDVAAPDRGHASPALPHLIRPPIV